LNFIYVSALIKMVRITSQYRITRQVFSAKSISGSYLNQVNLKDLNRRKIIGDFTKSKSKAPVRFVVVKPKQENISLLMFLITSNVGFTFFGPVSLEQ